MRNCCLRDHDIDCKSRQKHYEWEIFGFLHLNKRMTTNLEKASVILRPNLERYKFKFCSKITNSFWMLMKCKLTDCRHGMNVAECGVPWLITFWGCLFVYCSDSKRLLYSDWRDRGCMVTSQSGFETPGVVIEKRKWKKKTKWSFIVNLTITTLHIFHVMTQWNFNYFELITYLIQYPCCCFLFVQLRNQTPPVWYRNWCLGIIKLR